MGCAIALCLFVQLLRINCMLCHQVLSRSSRKFSYSHLRDHLFRQAKANAGLEVIFSFLLLKAHVSVSALSTGPYILNTLACELCMAFWRQKDGDTKIFAMCCNISSSFRKSKHISIICLKPVLLLTAPKSSFLPVSE